ncbi:unnamed protein product [Leptidea sinapis]|uniref:Uncharacterized protein n=1 Tax=Leptidea sinapis TaxID=189913 RepID=A0A5E4Q0S4_9NEOP|nr:unnamed protein product [Leptidea sinapis]
MDDKTAHILDLYKAQVRPHMIPVL